MKHTNNYDWKIITGLILGTAIVSLGGYYVYNSYQEKSKKQAQQKALKG